MELDLLPYHFGETESTLKDNSHCLSEATVLEQTIPYLASVPNIRRWSAEHEPVLNSLSYLFPALQEIHSAKLHQHLRREDILELGREAEGNEDHNLKCVATQLKNEGVAEEMVKIWNERHGKSTVGYVDELQESFASFRDLRLL